METTRYEHMIGRSNEMDREAKCQDDPKWQSLRLWEISLFSDFWPTRMRFSDPNAPAGRFEDFFPSCADGSKNKQAMVQEN